MVSFGLNVQVDEILQPDLADSQFLDGANSFDIPGDGRDLLERPAARASDPSGHESPGAAAECRSRR